MASHKKLYKNPLKVIEEYINEGKPYVLYLRSYDLIITHGKNDLQGRELLQQYIFLHLCSLVLQSYISLMVPITRTLRSQLN